MRRRILHPALRHGDLPHLYVDEHPHVLALGEALARPRGMLEGGPEFRRYVARDAQTVLQVTARQNIDTRRFRELHKVGQ